MLLARAPDFVLRDLPSLLLLLEQRKGTKRKTNKSRSQDNGEAEEEEEGVEKEYDDAYIPFGENWTSSKIKTHMRKKNEEKLKKLLDQGTIKSKLEFKPFYIVADSIFDCIYPSPDPFPPLVVPN